ncbi:PREDICTED: glycoprotein hormone beta-5-like [Priapulus caudatus]|uniref:Glycoprotein hormone beta-5-like n=1 Tax=Priapulus caudatus TaxID=37621 RepID=A0ABM1ETX2_PRICU|nr:PREDICTED: glycoprotein hormone beta-5-like [Priapulus caudatus]
MLVTIYTLLGIASFTAHVSAKDTIDPTSTLICHKREYSYRISKPHNGLPCWDDVSVMSCWGRCDSNEIGDWVYPFKISHHPVCEHEVRIPRLVRLRHCHSLHPDPYYEVVDAESCACKACETKDTSCESIK